MADFTREELMAALRSADAAGDTEAATRIAQMLQSTSTVESTPTFGERARAVGDVAGAVVGGAIAEPIAGLAGMATLPFAGAEKAAQVVGDVQSIPSEIMPKSDLGQEYLQNIGSAIEKVGDVVNPTLRGTVASLYGALPFVSSEEGEAMHEKLQGEGLGGDMGTVVLETTGSPALAALASAYPTAIAEIIGLKGAKNLKGDIPKSTVSQRPSVALSQATPEIDQIKTQSRDLYKEIDDMGVKMDGDKFVEMAISLRDKFNSMGLDKTLTPDASRIIDRFDELVDQDVSLSDLDTLRQLADIPARKFDNPREMALGNIAKEFIDDFIDAEGRRLASKGRVDVGEKIRTARNLWGRVRKGELFEEAIAKAKDTQSGFENGLRIEFRKILNNKKKLRGFTEAEQEAIRQVVQGGGIANTMKALGKFGVLGSGAGGPQATILAPMLGGSIASAITGNPVAGVAVPIIGQVSRELATKLTLNNAKMAQQIVQAGNDGFEIAKAYVRSIPKGQQSVGELTELLLRSDVDLSTIKEMAGEFGTMINDAKYVAEVIRDMGLTSLVAAPGAATGIEEAQQE